MDVKPDPVEVVLGNCWNMFGARLGDRLMPKWWCLADEHKKVWRDLMTEGDPVSRPAEVDEMLAAIPTWPPETSP